MASTVWVVKMAYPGIREMLKYLKTFQFSKKNIEIFNKISNLWDFLEIMKLRKFIFLRSSEFYLIVTLFFKIKTNSWVFSKIFVFNFFLLNFAKSTNNFNVGAFPFFSIFWIFRGTLGYVILQLWSTVFNEICSLKILLTCIL